MTGGCEEGCEMQPLSIIKKLQPGLLLSQYSKDICFTFFLSSLVLFAFNFSV